MASIFLLSHTSGNNLPSITNGLDKVCHAIAYGALTLSCLFAVHPWFRNRSFLELAMAAIAFSLLFGLSDEFHQTFIAHRSADWRDLVADVSGSVAAVLVWWRWGKRIGAMTLFTSLLLKR
ncbi:MAG: VanZ family protein [Desulfobulbaceae bacterium]|uniref:VanZ family protein n=1 Tax=Candidatus Desulfobia pelagia TaxID=2841692 RepID=A0A8J6NDX2_9BACT|nr:VanZ family protein [Candidatus Desulfobia pelagia]